MESKETILVINFDDSSSQLAARKIRDMGVYSEIIPHTEGIQKVVELAPKGIILSGDSSHDQKLVSDLHNIGYKVLSFRDDLIDKEKLTHFLTEECGCSLSWTPKTFVKQAIEDIRRKVKKDRVLCGLSGGVDSAVTAALIQKAVGSQLTCLYVNTGLMRLNEQEGVEREFKENLKANLIIIDAEERFLTALKDVTEPEKKRKIIGELFIRVFEEEAAKLGDFKYLAQGTLYPDVVESISTGNKDVAVKSHHNVGGLPENMKFELLEPVRELFKDEVREAGKVLGLSDDLVYRHPFPGPGLAVRIVGEITKEKCDTLRHADHIAIEEIKNAGLYREIWQAFCALLPVKSVGIKNGERFYGNVAVLRAVTGLDGMTAEWYPLPHNVMEKISNRIIYEVDGISRLVYDISSKPPATIEWE